MTEINEPKEETPDRPNDPYGSNDPYGRDGSDRPNDPFGRDDPEPLDVKASSATDCTGLIPALPQSDAELESYAELYPYPADIFQD